MKSKLINTLNSFIWALVLLAAYAVAAQGQTMATDNPLSAARKSGTLQLAGNTTAVTGSGTTGRLPKWTGLTSSSSFIGDSTIFEDKYSMVGIGTDTPTSKLTVAGMIQTTLGGLKFPDGTVQTTAAVSGLQSVFHNATLTGNGTPGSPLGVAVPLELMGTAGQIENPTLKITTMRNNGIGIIVIGGLGTGALDGGQGIDSTGGDAPLLSGGNGLISRGGSGFRGGAGVMAEGGNGSGTGNSGGNGVTAEGGVGDGAGKSGGNGIEAYPGPGHNGATAGFAGLFGGAVEVQGNFNVTGGGTKNFKIDHPLDPENKYLYHAAIESSEVLNIYSGNITTDENGEALVTLPEWFESINRDFRYQLTVVGQFAQAIVAGKIRDHRFQIKTNAANVEVSWQITGIRSDAAILKHPFKVEEDKPKVERGSYLTPDAYEQPEERGIEWARNPQLMQQRKQQRAAAEQNRKPHQNDNQ